MRGGILTIAALALGVIASPAFASGGGGGGGGSFPEPRQRGSDFNNQQSEAQRLQRRGASQVNRKITCKKCEYNGRLTSTTAPEIAQAVRNGRFDLSDRDRQAVLVFLRDRYGV